MQFRKEILRGVRLAAILFAIILVTVTSYRMLRVAPAQRQESREAAPSPATSPEPAPVSSAPTPAADVPAPPPAGVRAPVRKTPRQPANPVPSVAVMNNVEAVITAKPEPPTPVAAPEPLPPAPVITPQKTESAPPADGQKPRGRKLLRSVGRFLHVGGKKEPEAESVRQP